MVNETEKLLEILGGKKIPNSDEFKKLVCAVDTHNIIAKVFILEGTPFVFESSPMKYVIFREQVADRFGLGSQDVCIVGSARLGFSPSPTEKYGKTFKETSDVDVVIISEELFHHGSAELFQSLTHIAPPVYQARQAKPKKSGEEAFIEVIATDWVKVKESLRNYTFNNFNPGLLPDDSLLRQSIFDKISSTAGLFLALEPQVFVSKIRCRIFRSWKAAEDYYSNSLRQLKSVLIGNTLSINDSDDIDAEAIISNQKTA